jgi:large subunit ribosomal protein L21
MYAIVRTGGKQYRVEEGRSLDVERLPAEEGATVELGEVLLIAEDGSVTIGTPTIEGARVLAVVDQQGRSPKIIVFNYKNKVRTRKKQGHRQAFTRLTVQDILRPGQEATVKPPRARRSKAEAAEAVDEAPEDVAAEGVAEAITEAPAVEAPRKPRTPAREKPAPTKAKAAKEKPAAKPKAKAEKEKPKRPAAKKASAKEEKKPPARRRILRRKKED